MRLNLHSLMIIAIFAFSSALIISCDDPCDNCGPGTICIDDECVPVDPCAGISCDEGEICVDGSCVEADNLTLVSSNITENTEWTNDKVYVLTTRVSVESGSTLTIEAGTVIKGEAGIGSNSTALVIARGAQLFAMGTNNAPIIFTSIADQISPDDIKEGNFASPNMAPTINGLWGGVIILGNAKISASNDSDEDVSEAQIEGIPTSDMNGLYGGDDNADNSGIINYISIRHGGTLIGSGNEINGLTLGGVGSETIIENIEVVANQDDGIEWFGGTVDVQNVVIWNVGDDGIDTDQSWGGTLDNFIVVTPAGHCFELDGPEGSYTNGHTIKNGSIIAGGNNRLSEDLINVDENSIVDLENLYFTGVSVGQTVNRVDALGVNFTNININVDAADLASYINGEIPAGIKASNNKQADATLFDWTWANAAGSLDILK